MHEMFAPPARPNRCPTINYTRQRFTLRAFQNGVGGHWRWCVAPARTRPVFGQLREVALYGIQGALRSNFVAMPREVRVLVPYLFFLRPSFQVLAPGTWYQVLVTLSTGSTVTVLVTLSTGYCTCHVEYGYRTCSVQSSHHDPYLIKYSAAVFSGRFAKNWSSRPRQKRDMSWPRA